jgi:hypothetical protein
VADEEIAIIESYEDSEYNKFDSYISVSQPHNSKIKNLDVNQTPAVKPENEKIKLIDKTDDFKTKLTERNKYQLNIKEKVSREVNTDPVDEFITEDSNKQNMRNFKERMPDIKLNAKIEARRKIQEAKLKMEMNKITETLLENIHTEKDENGKKETNSREDGTTFIKINESELNSKTKQYFNKVYNVKKMEENISKDCYKSNPDSNNKNLLERLFNDKDEDATIDKVLTNLEIQQEYSYKMVVKLYENVLEDKNISFEFSELMDSIQNINLKLKIIKASQEKFPEIIETEGDYVKMKRPLILKNLIQVEEGKVKQSPSNKISSKGSGEKGINIIILITILFY